MVMLFALLPVVVYRGGRPAHPLRPEWRAHWSPLNEAPCPTSGVRSSMWAYFQLVCGCIIYKQIASMQRKPSTALWCPDHSEGCRQLSEAAQGVRAAMTSTVPDLGPVVREAHLLPGTQKPFDFWLPRYHIAIEVDGRPHFRGGMHGDTSAARERRDRAINAACRRRRLRLVRCHYADDQQWGRLVQQAVAAVKENPHCWFQVRTNSYAYEGVACRPAHPPLTLYPWLG